MPGYAATIPGAPAPKAMQTSDGSVTTETGDIARMLTEHWKKVFSHVQLDTSVMEAWLQHALPPVESDPRKRH